MSIKCISTILPLVVSFPVWPPFGPNIWSAADIVLRLIPIPSKETTQCIDSRSLIRDNKNTEEEGEEDKEKDGGGC